MLDEQKIISMAPNQNAVANGRKISNSNGFVKREKSKDKTFYMGECKGSGKSNYVVSGDFIDPDNPIFRCSCPSRQFPCKHSIGLMFEIISNKEFAECEIPDSIIEKRNKKEAREAKKEAEVKENKPKKVTKVSKAARLKKINKQLEGLELLKKMTDKLLSTGLASISGTSLMDYRSLNKQLGDYYLPGPQAIFTELIYGLEKIQGIYSNADTVKNQSHSSLNVEESNLHLKEYEKVIDCLKRLRFLTKKSTDYLNSKIENDDSSHDDNILYEALGGIWKLSELNALGLNKENAKLVQLSFEVIYDEAKKEFVDKGYWIDLEDGKISFTANYRPLKALKYINQEDSCFEVVSPNMLTYYPGNDIENKRIRWEMAALSHIGENLYSDIKKFAFNNIQEMVKHSKNELKNALSDGTLGVLIKFDKLLLERGSGKVLLKDFNDTTIELASHNQSVTQMSSIKFLPESVAENQVLFGLAYFDIIKNTIILDPRSIITDNAIIRLLY